MKDLKASTIVASEYPELRYSWTRVVQDELGGMVVAEAENVIRAVALAKTLRPDLIVVDDRLPHVVGVDGVPLSRIGGLDAAFSVIQELPRARVLLVSHGGEALAPNNKGEGGKELCLYQRANPAGGPLDQRLTFAVFREKVVPALRRKVLTVIEKVMLVGGLGMLAAGLSLMFTIILAPAGVVLAAAGVGVVLLSAGARAAVAAWPTRVRSRAGHLETQGERDDIEATLQRLPVI